MNTFATIVQVYLFRKVTYYSILLEENTQNLFLQFVNAASAEDESREELAIIRTWLTKLGNEIGAQERYFRFEGDARALPPPARHLNVSCDLRLYCMRVNAHIVILFNGAQKTAAQAQDCPNVRSHFALANKLSRAIHEAIVDRRIRISEDEHQLRFDEDFELEL